MKLFHVCSSGFFFHYSEVDHTSMYWTEKEIGICLLSIFFNVKYFWFNSWSKFILNDI